MKALGGADIALMFSGPIDFNQGEGYVSPDDQYIDPEGNDRRGNTETDGGTFIVSDPVVEAFGIGHENMRILMGLQKTNQKE